MHAFIDVPFGILYNFSTTHNEGREIWGQTIQQFTAYRYNII